MFNSFESIRRAVKCPKMGPALVLGAVLSLAGKKAQAIPSTLTFYPSTDIVSQGSFHFNASNYSKALKNTTFTSGGLTYGLGPDKDGFFGRTELGVDYITGGSSLADPGNGIGFGKRLWFNAKTQLYNNDKQSARLVAGFWGAGARGSLKESTFPPDTIYLLGSKSFGNYGRFHLGVAHVLQKQTFVGDANGNADRTPLQFGYDKTFAKGKLQFTFDAWTGKSAYSMIAPGLLYNINDKSDVQIGYLHFNSNIVDSRGNNVRNQIYMGFDYTFDFKKPAATPPATPAAAAPAGNAAPPSAPNAPATVPHVGTQ